MELLYQNSKVIKRLKEYFEPYLSLLTKPGGTKLFLVLLAMLSMQFVTSISFIYEWFLSSLCSLSLNSYYHLFTYTRIPLDAFFKVTVKMAISMIPEKLYGLPVFLIIDDTLQAKFGIHFECYQKLFDHAKRNHSNYLNGHCFVALMVSVPIELNGKIRYLAIPVGFRLRNAKENKLKIASGMVDTAMEILKEYPMVILLCDSWYPKGDVRKTVDRYDNLDLIANVRVDTSIFDLAPPPTGKRGRPAQKGRPLDVHTDFHFTKAEDYFIAAKHVMTNLFKAPVYLTVTTPNTANHASYRLFISTLSSEALHKQFKGYEKNLSESPLSKQLWLLPLYLYSYRWSVEILFYEMKTFWSFGSYMLRSKNGIENFENFFSMCYACMKILPVIDSPFSSLANESAQTSKYVIGDAIRQELFLWAFVSKTENGIKYKEILDSFTFSYSRNKQKQAS